MLRSLIVASLLAVAVPTSAALANDAPVVDGPAELPPDNFLDRQYVDSKGCVFLRAGYGGRTRWVPRLDRSRKPLCGQAPSLARAGQPAPEAEVLATEPGTATAPVAAAETSGVTQSAEPQATSQPTPQAEASAPAIAVSVPETAPVVAASPAIILATPVKASRKARKAPRKVRVIFLRPLAGCPGEVRENRAIRLPDGRLAAPCDEAGSIHVVIAEAPVRAQGYKPAFDDGRFNPQRGQGTLRGKKEMSRVWTDGTPARLKTTPERASELAADKAPKVVVAPASGVRAAAGGRFVQAGAFGEPDNAARAVARLRSLGLPVASQTLVSRGRSLQAVMAGPFGDAASLSAALAQLRRAGYPDAFVRY
ncbi:MAG: SPOR domain-containing protein [Paracoccaceae bacterium]